MASSNSITRHRASRTRNTTVSSLIREVRAVSRIQHSNLSIIIWWFSLTLILEWWVLSHTQTTLASIKISNNSSLVVCIQASRATCLAISPIRGPLTTPIIHNLMHHTTAAKVLPLSGSRIKISTTWSNPSEAQGGASTPNISRTLWWLSNSTITMALPHSTTEHLCLQCFLIHRDNRYKLHSRD